MAYASKEFVDYYQVLSLDKTLKTKALRKILISEQEKWSNRTNTPSDSKIMSDAKRMLEIVRDALRILGKEDKRKRYDEEWEARKEQGMLNTQASAEAANVVDRAVKYYQEGNLELAERFAREALQNDETNYVAYDVLTETLFDKKKYDDALKTVTTALERFQDPNTQIMLLEKIARYNYIGTKNFGAAQDAVNKMVEMGSYLGSVKQVLLYLFMDKEEQAKAEIQKYISEHAESTAFRREVAHGMYGYAMLQTYVMDSSKKAYVIISKESAEKNLRLATEAKQLMEDDLTKSWFDDAQYHLVKVFNTDNKLGVILWWVLVACCIVCGVLFKVEMETKEILSCLALPGIICLIVSIFITVGSFEPVWAYERKDLIGKRGFIGFLCDLLGKYATWGFKFSWSMTKWVFKVALHMFT